MIIFSNSTSETVYKLQHTHSVYAQYFFLNTVMLLTPKVTRTFAISITNAGSDVKVMCLLRCMAQVDILQHLIECITAQLKTVVPLEINHKRQNMVSTN